MYVVVVAATMRNDAIMRVSRVWNGINVRPIGEHGDTAEMGAFDGGVLEADHGRIR